MRKIYNPSTKDIKIKEDLLIPSGKSIEVDENTAEEICRRIDFLIDWTEYTVRPTIITDNVEDIKLWKERAEKERQTRLLEKDFKPVKKESMEGEDNDTITKDQFFNDLKQVLECMEVKKYETDSSSSGILWIGPTHYTDFSNCIDKFRKFRKLLNSFLFYIQQNLNVRKIKKEVEKVEKRLIEEIFTEEHTVAWGSDNKKKLEKEMYGNIERLFEIQSLFRGAKTKGSHLIKPRTPFSNKQYLERLLEDCKDFILWVDWYFSKPGLIALRNAFSSPEKVDVGKVKILSSFHAANAAFRDMFKDFKKEFEYMGVIVEMRVVTDSKVLKDTHDRFIFTKDNQYNVPSTDVIARGQYSEISPTSSIVPYENWWKASPDIISDWNKILKKQKDYAESKEKPS